MINEKGIVETKAYFKNVDVRRAAVKKIVEKRKNPIIFYNILPEKEKIGMRKRIAKYQRLNREKLNQKSKNWRLKNPEKYKEHKAKSDNLNKNKLKARSWTKYHREEILKVKGEICETCGSISNIEIHHKEYTNNLKDLQILCRLCHRTLDRKYSNKQLGIV